MNSGAVLKSQPDWYGMVESALGSPEQNSSSVLELIPGSVASNN